MFTSNMKSFKKLRLFLIVIVAIGTSYGFYSAKESIDAVDVAADHSKLDALLKKHVSSSGKVNYAGFKTDVASLDAYLKNLSANVPASGVSKNDKLAYWMNAYNAFTVKLILNNYPVSSIKKISSDPWKVKFIKLGQKTYDLSTIEHGILRKMGDARIHVGINCASVSCPKLANKAFTAANVQSELTRLTKAFIKDKSKNQISANEVKLSKIFDWFKSDFASKGTLIDWINKYSDVKINAKAKVSYLTYNWNLNK
jgi:hypothetical protein